MQHSNYFQYYLLIESYLSKCHPFYTVEYSAQCSISHVIPMLFQHFMLSQYSEMHK